MSAIACTLFLCQIAGAEYGAAPRTVETDARLDRAAQRIEPPSRGDPDAIVALFRYYDKVYTAAGFSLAKSLDRYLDDTLRDGGMAPMGPGTDGIRGAYVALLSAKQEQVPLESVFPPAVAKSFEEKLGKLERAWKSQRAAEQKEFDERRAEMRAESADESRRDEERAAHDRAQERERNHQREQLRAEERRAAKERTAARLAEGRADTERIALAQREDAVRVATEWARWVQGHYTVRPTSRSYLDLQYVGENVYRIAGQRSDEGYAGVPSTVCQIPPTDVPFQHLSTNRLTGSAETAGCPLRIELFPDGRLQVLPSRVPACDALCTGGKFMGLTVTSSDVKRRHGN
jgi:hypothetical protein